MKKPTLAQANRLNALLTPAVKCAQKSNSPIYLHLEAAWATNWTLIQELKGKKR